MTTPSIIIFAIAAIFYCLTWVYIRQLVRDVNANPGQKRVSLWWWLSGWKRHRSLYPASAVRARILACISTTAALLLVVFVIEVRHMFARLNLR
jgi:energy-coupling factor transporter transmembrane protein EcfT